MKNISNLFVQKVHAQTMPAPDFSVYESSEFEPIRKMGNITLGIVLGIALIWGAYRIIASGMLLQSAGDDLGKRALAKESLKNAIVGLAISLAAISVVGILAKVLGVVGLSN